MKDASVTKNEIDDLLQSYLPDDYYEDQRRRLVPLVLKYVQEYADLQVKAFKEKLKKQLEYEDREVDWITIEYIQKLIDRI